MPKGDRRPVFQTVIIMVLCLASAGAVTSSSREAASQKQKAKPAALNPDSPCYPVDQIKSMASDPAHLDCQPVRISVSWDIEERISGADGRADWVRFTLTEEYPGYIMFDYESGSRKKLNSLWIKGPSPASPGSIQVDIPKLQGSISGWKEANPVSGSQARKSFPLPGGASITVASVDEDGLASCGFETRWNAFDDSAQAGLSSSDLNLAGAAVPAPYSRRPEFKTLDHYSARLEASGNTAFTDHEILKGLKDGSLAKIFSDKQQGPGSFGGLRTDQRGTSIEAAVRISFGAGGQARRGRVEKTYLDTNCPKSFYGKAAYSIALSDNGRDLNISVRIKLKKGKAVPFKSVNVSASGASDIGVSVTDKDKKIPQAIEVPDDQLDRLKLVWESEIEDTWNGQYVLERMDRKGQPVKINIGSEFVDSAEFDHEVEVYPGDLRSDEAKWYAQAEAGMAAHEFGHMLGNIDEYYAPDECAGRPRPKDKNIMASDLGGTPRIRHFQQFADWLKSVTGVSWKIVKVQ